MSFCLSYVNQENWRGNQGVLLLLDDDSTERRVCGQVLKCLIHLPDRALCVSVCVCVGGQGAFFRARILLTQPSLVQYEIYFARKINIILHSERGINIYITQLSPVRDNM